MSLDLRKAHLSVAMLACVGLGQAYPRDATGYEYIPSFGKKREPRSHRTGRFTRQRAICRRAMRRAFFAAKRPIESTRGAIRFPRAVSPSLAAWRKAQPRLATWGMLAGKEGWF